jgi:hypothetical protein
MHWPRTGPGTIGGWHVVTAEGIPAGQPLGFATVTQALLFAELLSTLPDVSATVAQFV